MKRSLAALLALAGAGSALWCQAQTVTGLNQKADVLVEVQQIPLESFGTPADVPTPDRWSTWLVRVTNRCKYPVFVQGYETPHPLRDLEELVGTSLMFSYHNWTLRDGDGTVVGKVVDQLGSSPSPAAPDRPEVPDTGVMDYLMAEKGLLAHQSLQLAPPARPYYPHMRSYLQILWEMGRRVANDWFRAQRRIDRVDITDPLVGDLEPAPCPALWPGETTWGWLVFWRDRQTPSTTITPRCDLGSGVTRLVKANPKLLDEFTRPEAGAAVAPVTEHAMERWLREHGYVTEEGGK